ncbi:MAG: hypothetical protein ACYSW2_07115 [Planctomycetota bacterium]|jgi:hypothetical protein
MTATREPLSSSSVSEVLDPSAAIGHWFGFINSFSAPEGSR